MSRGIGYFIARRKVSISTSRRSCGEYISSIALDSIRWARRMRPLSRVYKAKTISAYSLKSTRRMILGWNGRLVCVQCMYQTRALSLYTIYSLVFIVALDNLFQRERKRETESLASERYMIAWFSSRSHVSESLTREEKSTDRALGASTPSRRWLGFYLKISCNDILHTHTHINTKTHTLRY